MRQTLQAAHCRCVNATRRAHGAGKLARHVAQGQLAHRGACAGAMARHVSSGTPHYYLGTSTDFASRTINRKHPVKRPHAGARGGAARRGVRDDKQARVSAARLGRAKLDPHANDRLALTRLGELLRQLAVLELERLGQRAVTACISARASAQGRKGGAQRNVLFHGGAPSRRPSREETATMPRYLQSYCTCGRTTPREGRARVRRATNAAEQASAARAVSRAPSATGLPVPTATSAMRRPACSAPRQSNGCAGVGRGVNKATARADKATDRQASA